MIKFVRNMSRELSTWLIAMSKFKKKWTKAVINYFISLQFLIQKFINYIGVGVLRDIYFSPPLWLTKVKEVDFIYLR